MQCTSRRTLRDTGSSTSSMRRALIGEVCPREYPKSCDRGWRVAEHRVPRARRIRPGVEVVRAELDRSCAQAGAGTAPESGHELRRLREHDEEFQHHARATTTRLAGTASGLGRANHGAPRARIQLPPALTLPASLEVPATGG